ncbi:unnamed protein product [Chrysoparadoxa australica]
MTHASFDSLDAKALANDLQEGDTNRQLSCLHELDTASKEQLGAASWDLFYPLLYCCLKGGDVSLLAASVLRSLGEGCSARELHLIALESLSRTCDGDNPMGLRLVIELEARALARMEPTKRVKFQREAAPTVLAVMRRILSPTKPETDSDMDSVDGSDDEGEKPPPATVVNVEVVEQCCGATLALIDTTTTEEGGTTRAERSETMAPAITVGVATSVAALAGTACAKMREEGMQALTGAVEPLLLRLLAGGYVELEYLLTQNVRIAYYEWQGRPGRKLRDHPNDLDALTVAGVSPWSSLGIAVMAYSLITSPALARWIPTPWSPQQHWSMLHPSGVKLLQAAASDAEALGWAGLEVLSASLRHGIEGIALPYRPQLGDDDVPDSAPKAKEVFTPSSVDPKGLLEDVATVVVRCPLAQVRARGHKTMESAIACVPESDRLALLSDLVDTCPYSQVTGLFLDAARKQVHAALTKALQHRKSSSLCTPHGGATAAGGREPNNVFLSAAVGEWVLKRLDKAATTPSDRMLSELDVHMAAVTFYRYLLMRDKGVEAQSETDAGPSFQLGVRGKGPEERGRKALQNIKTKATRRYSLYTKAAAAQAHAQAEGIAEGASGTKEFEECARGVMAVEVEMSRGKRSNRPVAPPHDYHRLDLLVSSVQQALEELSAL